MLASLWALIGSHPKGVQLILRAIPKGYAGKVSGKKEFALLVTRSKPFGGDDEYGVEDLTSCRSTRFICG